MTPEQRRSADNGLWMCRIHGATVDAKDSKFTVKLLKEWRAQALLDSWQRVSYSDASSMRTIQPASDSDLITRIKAAASTDLEAFRRSDKWPSTAIELTLSVDGLNASLSTSALAAALATLNDLIIVAPPGTGKTTTLFQIAEAAISSNYVIPIIIPLGDWSAGGTSILESVLKRHAFRGITEVNLCDIAARGEIALLLDGWNELDGEARKRATAELRRMAMELPELKFLISTRKQALDVPIDGQHVDILPLNEKQQLQIAQTLRGDSGARIIDQAWRTHGINEIVTIPLYLTSLLALPEGTPFPTTKEELLRLFVAAHEGNTSRAEELSSVVHHLHHFFLEDLAVAATRAANTTIDEAAARKSISSTADKLITDGQLAAKPQPNAVLEVLANHHVLMRAGNPAGYSFQHQQFQEWYASNYVENLIIDAVNNTASQNTLMAEILNLPEWEETILFACERLSRGDQKQQDACAATILSALTVDPMLAATMIHHSTDGVWSRISDKILSFVNTWHKPDKVDRAVRFMINSGRPEFIDQIWPLITHKDSNIHLSALRSCRRFPISVLGKDAAKRLVSLPAEIRKTVLHEIAINSGIDGLDLIASVVANDPDVEVKVFTINAFLFRSANRHVVQVLQNADEQTFDLTVQKNIVDQLDNEPVDQKIEAARTRILKGSTSYEEIRRILYIDRDEDQSAEISALIAAMELHEDQDHSAHIIVEAHKRYPRAVAEGLLERVRLERFIPYWGYEVMAGTELTTEDETILKIALKYDERSPAANAAAAVLGPESVAQMIDRMFEARKVAQDGAYNKQANEVYHAISGRIAVAPIESLLKAIGKFSAKAGNQEMAELARLLSSHADGKIGHKYPYEAAVVDAIADLTADWGSRLLTSNDTTRPQLAAIADMVSKIPTKRMLAILKRLLDEDLRRWRIAKEQAVATGYRGRAAPNDAQTSWTLQYQRAFVAIEEPEVAEMMQGYLQDREFGEEAARVLMLQWRAKNGNDDNNKWMGYPDFSHVAEKRALRLSAPNASSSEADAIFETVDQLLRKGTNLDKNLAFKLGSVGILLPHGQRPETVKALLGIGNHRNRLTLLNGATYSGEEIDIDIVKQGIEDVLEAAKKEPWILGQQNDELRGWLRLLPFTNHPKATLEIVGALPEQLRGISKLDGLLEALGVAPGNEAEEVLFDLAKTDPCFYNHRTWYDAVVRRKTDSSAIKFLDLAINGSFNSFSVTDQRRTVHLTASLIGEYPTARIYAYQLIKDDPGAAGIELLAHAISENPDMQGLLLLVKFSEKQGRAIWSPRTVELAITKREPSENWQGAYDLSIMPSIELRRELLAMVKNGGAKDFAAQCLTTIDAFRDSLGSPETEPRHPDLTSGKPWPITG